MIDSIFQAVWGGIMAKVVAAILLFLGLGGCATLAGSDKSTEDQMLILDKVFEIGQEYNAGVVAKVDFGGRPKGFAETSFGVDTDLTASVTLTLQADDPKTSDGG